MTDFSALAASLAGSVLLPDDPGFAAAATGFNTAVVHAPEAIVAVASADDVVATIAFAREQHLPLHIQATGHGAVVPFAGGVLISTRLLTQVSIDAGAQTATFGGGSPWGPIVAAAAEHGLAPIIGSSPTVGAVGYLLGGGLGPLARSHGFSSDYLRSLRVVTGTGELVTASADENPDLFWALRGGKGGLGVVVEATVALIELSTLYGGTLFFDIADAERVLNGWIAWGAESDTRATTSVLLAKFPDFEAVPPPLRGRHLLALRFAFPGESAEGERLAAPLRALAPIHLDGLGELPAAQISRIHNDPTDPGPGWGFGAAFRNVDAGWVTAMLASFGPGTELPLIGAEIRQLGGAIRDDVEGGSAIGGRDAEYLMHVIGAPNPALFAEVLPGVEKIVLASLAPWIAPTSTINWVDAPSDPAQFASAWPDATRERLAAVRTEHDPDHVFPYGPG
jgi:hypothetical protein